MCAYPGISPILNNQGQFAANRIREIFIFAALREFIFQEWSAQIERLLTMGGTVSKIEVRFKSYLELTSVWLETRNILIVNLL